MTQWMLVTLGLAIAGQVVYQIAQRAVPHDASPLMVLAVAYFAAGALCLGLGWPFGVYAGGAKLRLALGWPTWLIAVSVVAIEIGYLTAYRSGWTIDTAYAAASCVTLFILALVGWSAIGNTFSLRQLGGLICACVGVWLLSTGGKTP
jgi:multidrug transporter EmrE-like cation transporter